MTDTGTPSDPAPGPSVADLEPGDEQAAALQGASTMGAPGAADTPGQSPGIAAAPAGSAEPADPGGTDTMAPGASIADPDSPDVEPNEPA